MAEKYEIAPKGLFIGNKLEALFIVISIDVNDVSIDILVEPLDKGKLFGAQGNCPWAFSDGYL